MVRNFFSPGGGTNGENGRRLSRKERLDQAKKMAAAETEKSRRRNFGFLKTAADKSSRPNMSKTREHAKKLAMAYHDHAADPFSSSGPISPDFAAQGLLGGFDQPSPTNPASAFPDDGPFHFDPFQTGPITASTALTTTKGDPFATASSSNTMLDHHFVSNADREYTASTEDSFETASVGSAYDMDFLGTAVSTTNNTIRKKKNTSLASFVEANYVNTSIPADVRSATSNGSRRRRAGGGSASGSVGAKERSVISSMSTFPANSSMQASFARQRTKSSNVSSNSSVGSATGAAARRRMRNQMRQHSSGSSVCSTGSDASSYCSGVVAPESPSNSSVQRMMPGSNPRNRLSAYQRGNSDSFYSQASSTNRSNSDVSGSSPNLFDSHVVDGGFTFDAFGLDQSQLEREVDEAMKDLAGQGMTGFNLFFDDNNNRHQRTGSFSTAASHSAGAIDEFAPQHWDNSPAGSRRSSPAPVAEDGGFVDGFRVAPSASATPPRSAQLSPPSSTFHSPASRRINRSQATGTARTPPRWENHPKQQTRLPQQHQHMSPVDNTNIFDDPISNPWKEDPWGSDPEDSKGGFSSGGSDFETSKSDMIQSSPSAAEFERASHMAFESKSDVAGTTFASRKLFQQRQQQSKAVSFHQQAPVPQQGQGRGPLDGFQNARDEEMDLQEDLAQEFAQEFQKKVSPRGQAHGDFRAFDDHHDDPHGYGAVAPQEASFQADFQADFDSQYHPGQDDSKFGVHSPHHQQNEQQIVDRSAYGHNEAHFQADFDSHEAASDFQSDFGAHGPASDAYEDQHYASAGFESQHEQEQFRHSPSAAHSAQEAASPYSDHEQDRTSSDQEESPANYRTRTTQEIDNQGAPSRFSSFRSKYESSRESTPNPPSNCQARPTQSYNTSNIPKKSPNVSNYRSQFSNQNVPSNSDPDNDYEYDHNVGSEGFGNSGKSYRDVGGPYNDGGQNQGQVSPKKWSKPTAGHEGDNSPQKSPAVSNYRSQFSTQNLQFNGEEDNDYQYDQNMGSEEYSGNVDGDERGPYNGASQNEGSSSYHQRSPKKWSQQQQGYSSQDVSDAGDSDAFTRSDYGPNHDDGAASGHSRTSTVFSNAQSPRTPTKSPRGFGGNSRNTASEEKKDDDSPVLPVGRLRDKWKQWEAKEQAKSPTPAVPKPKWQAPKNNTSNSANPLDIEMLTPVIVEERRQEKRRFRVEELRNSEHSEPPPVYSRETESDHRRNEYRDPRSSVGSGGSVVSERSRASSSMGDTKAKSDAGGYRSNVAGSVVDRLRRESPRNASVVSTPSPQRETKSDAGGTPSFLANVKLRKTGNAGNFEVADNTEVEGTQDKNPTPTSSSGRPMSYGERMSQSPRQSGVEPERQQSQPAPPPEKKLTYRERRELELKREQEEKAKQQQKQESPPKKDVAALIRKRIAANKQKGPENQDSGGTNGPASLRDRLKPVATATISDSQHSQSTEQSFRQDQQSPRNGLQQSPRWSEQDYNMQTGQPANNRVDMSQQSPRWADRQNDQGLQSPHGGSNQSLPSPRNGVNTQQSPSWSDKGSLQNFKSPRNGVNTTQQSPRWAERNDEQNFQSPRNGVNTVQQSPRWAERDDEQNFQPPSNGVNTAQQSPRWAERDHQQSYEQQQPSPRHAHQDYDLPPVQTESQHDSNGIKALIDAVSPSSAGSEMEYSTTSEKTSPRHLAQSQPDTKGRGTNNGDASNGEMASANAPPRMKVSCLADGDEGKSDVKSMLSNFLGARNNPLSSIPAPTKDDDGAALSKNKKHFEELSSPRNAEPEYTAPAPPPATAIAPGERPALKNDPNYERYFRMLKVGIPIDDVKHAMVRDGKDPSVMDGDHNKPVGLPLKEDPKYAKYFKMLKLGITMEQVKHSMEVDGLMPGVMDQDHSLSAQACEKRCREQQEKKTTESKDTHRRARLHWKTLQKVSLNSLWGKLEREPSIAQLSFDEEEFQELFQASATPSNAGKASAVKANRKKGVAVRVIDAKRANNGGIILARVKMTHDEMADAVDRMDADVLSAEQIENVIEYLPSKDERDQLEKFMLEGGSDAAEKFDGLCECEKFMVSMMTVKHAKRKIRALLFKLQFMSCIQSIADDARTIDFACDELKQSTRLRQLLGIVLQFGNRLNTAGGKSKQKAGAFTLDSLLKLNQAKAFDKKTTFLHYVVLIVQRNNELLLNFKDDLPTVLKAEKVYWDQVLTDLEEVENQLENVRRISLHEARSSPHRSQKKGSDDDSLGEMELSLEEEVEALRATRIGLFTLSAIKQVSSLRDKVEGTRSKFEKLLEYFGEDGKTMQPQELFGIFSKFCRDFEKAKVESLAKMKKKQRDERKKVQKKGLPPSGAPERNPKPLSLRASNFQPNMSAVMKGMTPPPKANYASPSPTERNVQNHAPGGHSQSQNNGYSAAPGSSQHQQNDQSGHGRPATSPRNNAGYSAPSNSRQHQRMNVHQNDQYGHDQPAPSPRNNEGYSATPSSNQHQGMNMQQHYQHDHDRSAVSPRNNIREQPELAEEPAPRGMQESGRFEGPSVSPSPVSSPNPNSTSMARNRAGQREMPETGRYQQTASNPPPSRPVTRDPRESAKAALRAKAQQRRQRQMQVIQGKVQAGASSAAVKMSAMQNQGVQPRIPPRSQQPVKESTMALNSNVSPRHAMRSRHRIDAMKRSPATGGPPSSNMGADYGQ